MGCSRRLSVAGSGQHRRARRRRGDSAWLSPRAPLAGLLLLGAVLQPALGRAFPGGLDASFGTGGTVTTDFGGGETAFALVRQSDGKLVAAGWSADAAGGARLPPLPHHAGGEPHPAVRTRGPGVPGFRGEPCAGGGGDAPGGRA